ncbi:MAG: DSD1 family PLP-dependent enzyme [Rhizobiaceae bacterium]
MTQQISSDLGPNKGLVGRPGSRHELVTPCLVVDRDRLMANMRRAMRIAKDAGMELWPHAKTHKCASLAKLQLENGAGRICVANLHEAECLAANGVDRLLITSAVQGENKIGRLAALAGRCPDLIVVVDGHENARAVDAAASQRSVTIDALIDVDIGMGRTGVPTLEMVSDLAARMLSAGALRLRGVQGYSGRVQHIHDFAERRRVYGAHLEVLARAGDVLRGLGIADPVVTGGGTGTLAIDASTGIVRQQQSGSYVFMDVQYAPVDLTEDGSEFFEPSLSLRASVVNAYVKGQVTLDAGTKSLATDGPKPVVSRGPAQATYEFFGDEHGRLVLADGAVPPGRGEAVELVTPHCDPTVNLHDFLHVVSGDTLVDIWPIEGRGSL